MRNDSKNVITGKLPSPFFIMGCQRSGTTLMARILDSHSRLGVFIESHYYTRIRRDLYLYGDLRKSRNLLRLIADLLEINRMKGVKSPEIDEFLNALAAPTFEGVLTTLLHLYASSQGKKRGGDKTPEHYIYLSEILEKFPESPVIFLIRDPRDTVFSIRKAFGTSIEGATWKWNQAFLSYQQASRPVHLVRYEELVRKPAEIVEAICAFLRENYESSVLRYYERIPPAGGSFALPHHKKLLGPVDTGSVGGFRQMPSHEIRQIEAACVVGMETMGYPFTVSGPNVVKLTVPKKPGFLKSLLDQLHYYRGNRERLRRACFRWKLRLRVRVRYLLMLGPLRNTW